MIEDRPLRLGIWVAVSSKAQATEDKISLEDQERRGRAFAEELGAELVSVYRVPGQSRDLVLWSEAETKIAAYRRLRADLESGRLDLLWALDIDRLGRDPALSSQVLSLAERHGAEVYLSTAPHAIGNQTIGHRYIAAIQAVRAKEDQARRVKNWYMGMENRARRGLPHHWPHGYRPIRDPQTGRITGAEFDPDKIPAVQMITDLFLDGHSYHAIVNAMNNSPYQPPQGSRWIYCTVREFMNNDLFAGIVTWRGEPAAERSPHYPALWDPETHRKIQRERQRRIHAWTRRGGSPLAGIAFCARCGSRMHRNVNRADRVRLRCGRHAVKHRTGLVCHPNSIREDHAIAAVAQFIAEHLTPADIAAAVSENDAGAPLRERLQETAGLIDRLENQRRRLALDRASGIMLAGPYRAADDSILARLESAESQAAQLRAQLAALPDPTARAAHLQDLAQNFGRYLTEKPASEIAAALQNAGIEIWLDAGAVSFIGFRE